MILSYRGAELIGRLARSSGRGFEEFTSEGTLKKLVKTFVSPSSFARTPGEDFLDWLFMPGRGSILSWRGRLVLPSKIPRYTLRKTG